MFFYWGARRDKRTFFNAREFSCPHCAKDQPGDVALVYTVRHVWVLFRWVTDKSCYVVCSICHTRGADLNAKAFEAKLSKPAIPFMDRMGWAVGLGIATALIGSAVVAEGFDKKNDLVYLRAPQVGDVYEMDFGRSADTNCSDCQYGAALVTEADPRGARVRLSKVVYNKLSGASAFATGSRGHDPSAYSEETYLIPTDRLLEMRQKGEMMDVVR
jgi:hypothetical protein